ncbi:hypothetical protein D9613_012693 [Agrocybe pediades]|uniref:Uncharacterized protein n=1 Tax=Agrocybe pediades TaxID=84607 RepID=A0A8H4VIV1_9AGAR|nr:hypothetical protein D9613_012693 [Agrocybe pediades]
MDLQLDAVLGVFQRRLQDQESIEVRYAALEASVAFLTACDSKQLALNIAHDRKNIKLSLFINISFDAHAIDDLTFYQLRPSVSNAFDVFTQSHPPSVDCGPTRPAVRPFPAAAGAGGSGGRRSAFMFPPGGSSPNGGMDHGLDDGDDDTQNADGEEDNVNAELDLERDERSTLRLSALEFMISLSESRPSMVKKVNGWTEVIWRMRMRDWRAINDLQLSRNGCTSSIIRAVVRSISMCDGRKGDSATCVPGRTESHFSLRAGDLSTLSTGITTASHWRSPPNLESPFDDEFDGRVRRLAGDTGGGDMRTRRQRMLIGLPALDTPPLTRSDARADQTPTPLATQLHFLNLLGGEEAPYEGLHAVWRR